MYPEPIQMLIAVGFFVIIYGLGFATGWVARMLWERWPRKPMSPWWYKPKKSKIPDSLFMELKNNKAENCNEDHMADGGTIV